MRFRARTIQTFFLLLLPVAVAAFGWGVGAAVLLVLVGLIWKWMLNASAMARVPEGPGLTLETISGSHFVEKVRWSMDLLGVPYKEEHNAGVLGVFALGRTVPRLHARTGGVTSVIGNSSDILRYLYGRYVAEYGERAAFLKPTSAAVELERRFDEYGVNVQRWLYFHLLPHRDITLYIWGRNDPTLPLWQRATIVLIYPLMRIALGRALGVSSAAHRKSVEEIEKLLSDVDQRLADGRTTLTGEPLSFADITFAALSMWVYADAYGGGKADQVIYKREELPEAMQREANSWRENYPHATGFVERLYRERRHV